MFITDDLYGLKNEVQALYIFQQMCNNPRVLNQASRTCYVMKFF